MLHPRVQLGVGVANIGIRTYASLAVYATLVVLVFDLGIGCSGSGDCPGTSLICFSGCHDNSECQTTAEELDSCQVRECFQGICLSKGLCGVNEVCADGECSLKSCVADADCNDDNECTVDKCSNATCDYGAVCPSGELCNPETGECEPPGGE